MTVAVAESRVVLKGEDRASGKIDQVNRALNRVENAADKTARASQSAGDKMRRAFGAQMLARVAGLAAAMGALRQVMASGDAAVGFSDELAKIQTLIGSNVDRMAELKAGIIDISKETGKPLADVSGAVFQVISAFGDTTDTLDATRIAAKGAVAGVAETGQAVKLANVFMKNYGDTSAAAMQRVLDLSFEINRVGVTNFEELSASMGGVIPIAAPMNVSMEEVAATFAALTGTSGNAAEVVTQFKAILIGLADTSKGAGNAVQDLFGVTAEAAIAEHGFMTVLKGVVETTDGSVGALKELFGRKEAILGILPLLNEQSDKYAGTLDATKTAVDGAAEAFKAAGEGMGAIGRETKQLEARLAALEVRLGDQVAPKTLAVKVNLLEAADATDLFMRGVSGDIAALDMLAAKFGLASASMKEFSAVAAEAAPRGIFKIGDDSGAAPARARPSAVRTEIDPMSARLEAKLKRMSDQRVKRAQAARQSVVSARSAESSALIEAINAEIEAEAKRHRAMVDHAFVEQDLAKTRAAMLDANRQRIHDARKDDASKAKAAAQATVNASMAIGAAGIAAAEQLGAATIAISGMRATYALAVGWMAIAEKGPLLGAPQLIAGLTAAAQFASLAGSGGGSPSASAPGGAGGSFGGAGSSTASARQKQASKAPTIINLFGVHNTKAELGHAQAKSMAAAAGTGMVPA